MPVKGWSVVTISDDVKRLLDLYAAQQTGKQRRRVPVTEALARALHEDEEFRDWLGEEDCEVLRSHAKIEIPDEPEKESV